MTAKPKDWRSGKDSRAQAVDESTPLSPERKVERRMGERRDSPRIPMKILVRQVELGGSFEERPGDLGVGGAFFEERSIPVGRRVELRFRLPGLEREVRCQGEVLRVSREPEKAGVHVRFMDLPTEVELAIARFIDDDLLKKGEN